MGHKVNPISFRLNYSASWRSRWFGKKNIPETLHEDENIRKIIKSKLAKASVEKVEIERIANLVTVFIYSGRPGVIIGRGGTGVEDLKKDIKKASKLAGDLKVDIIEVKDPESSSAIVGQEIASQIERRIGWKRALKRTIEVVSKKRDVKGVKIAVSGRLDGAEMGRREWLAKGKIPLHTLRSIIDFSRTTAFTTYGTIGIKVWIYKGEMLEERPKSKNQIAKPQTKI